MIEFALTVAMLVGTVVFVCLLYDAWDVWKEPPE